MCCEIIVPRQKNVVGYRDDGYLAECILPDEHWSNPNSYHVVKTPEGKYFAWKDDWECDCCEPEEDGRCYVWWEISELEVLALFCSGRGSEASPFVFCLQAIFKMSC